jgi:hypothetical protein
MRAAQSRYDQALGWTSPLACQLDGPQTLVLAFAAPELGADPRPWQELGAAFPQAVVAGCSTAGEIAGGEIHDASISVAVVRFEGSGLRPAWTGVGGAQDSLAAGQRLAEQLSTPLSGQALRAVFVLSEGLGVNGTALVRGLSKHLPPGVALTGGLAGDGSRFGHTWVLGDQRTRVQGVSAVGFYGSRLQVGQGCEGGWCDFGPERRITRARDNVLFELDGKPALALYKTYLGERAAGLPGTALLFPLAIRREGSAGDAVVRTVLGVDEGQQSLTFAGDVPLGATARLMRANTDKLVDSAGRAGRAAAESADGAEQALVVSVSCVGRRLVMGQRTEEEVEIVDNSAAGRAAHLGFYSYGEIASHASGAGSDLHNQTMTVTVFGES